MVITQLDRTTVRLLEDALLEAARPVAARYGLEVESAAGTYNDTMFKASVRFTLPADAPAARERLARAFLGTGIKPEIVGERFAWKRHTFTVVGFKPYAKFCVQATRDDGKPFGFTYATVMAALPAFFTDTAGERSGNFA